MRTKQSYFRGERSRAFVWVMMVTVAFGVAGVGRAQESRAANAATRADVEVTENIEIDQPTSFAAGDPASEPVSTDDAFVVKKVRRVNGGAMGGGHGGDPGDPFGAAPESVDHKVTWLGISTEEAPDLVTSQLKLDPGVGLVVTYVAEGSPADKAGLKKNDLLVGFNEQALVLPAQLRKLVQSRAAGDKAELTFYRQGEKRTVQVRLGENHVGPFGDPEAWKDQFKSFQKQFGDVRLGDAWKENMKHMESNWHQMQANQAKWQEQLARAMQQIQNSKVQEQIARAMEQVQKADIQKHVDRALEQARRALEEAERKVGEGRKDEAERYREQAEQLRKEAEEGRVEVEEMERQLRVESSSMARGNSGMPRGGGSSGGRMGSASGGMGAREPSVTIRSRRSTSQSMVRTDDSGTYVLVRNPRLRLTVHDSEGNLRFDGEIETEEQRSEIPGDLWIKVEPMVREMTERSSGHDKEHGGRPDAPSSSTGSSQPKAPKETI